MADQIGSAGLRISGVEFPSPESCLAAIVGRCLAFISDPEDGKVSRWVRNGADQKTFYGVAQA
jgi:hypothetical protein